MATHVLPGQVRSQKGFALTDALLALVIVIAVGSIGYFVYQRAFGSVDVQRARNEITSIQDAIAKIRGGRSTTNITTQTLVNGNLVPELTEGATLQNPWGGTYEVAPAQVGGASDNAFSITVSNIPTQTCTALASTYSAIADVVEVEGTVVRDRIAGTAYNESTVATQCAAGADAATVAITLTK